jgi:hypothetical protein
MPPGFALREFFNTHWFVDFALVFTSAEYVFIAWRRQWRPKAMIDLLFALAPGVCLMLALRAALSGAGAPWVLAFLSASLPLHLADLARRVPR